MKSGIHESAGSVELMRRNATQTEREPMELMSEEFRALTHDSKNGSVRKIRPAAVISGRGQFAAKQ